MASSRNTRRVLPCLWLVVLATVMTSELHAAEESLSLEKKTDPIDKLPPMVNAGLTNMGEWADANKALEKTNNKLRKRLSVPWETKISKDCCDYHEIPWFRFGYMGKTFKNKSKGDCETMCNQYIGCKSFSYNFKDKECVWSSQKPTYSADWRFYSKITNLQGKPNGKYHMFPGMKFLEPSKDIKHKISLEQCQYACTKDLGCKSFSYSQTKLECSTGETNVGYSESWQFFEKDMSKFKKPGFTEKHEKENAQKEETKRNYIFDIDKHNREKMAKRKKELADKAMLERKVKKDKKKKENAAKKDEKLMKRSEKCAKVSNKADENNKKIVAKDKIVTKKLNKTRKAAEVLQKARLKAQHSEKKMKLGVKIKTTAKSLGVLKQTHRQNKIMEVNAKKTKRKDMERCRKSVEKKHKEDQKMKERKIKAWEAKQAAKAAAREKKSKTCKKDIKAEQARDAEIKATEKAAKKNLAVKESQTARWSKKAKLATKEGHKKKAVEKLKEAKEAVKKAKNKEGRRVAKEIRFERKTKAFKEKCAKKEKKKKEKALKVKKKEAEIAAKKKAKEEGEKRVLKEAATKGKEQAGKERAKKETASKEHKAKMVKEKLSKERRHKETLVKEAAKKVEMKAKAERKAKEKARKIRAEKHRKELGIKETTAKEKRNKELTMKEKRRKESKAKERAAKKAEKMSKEQKAKMKERSNKKKERARKAVAERRRKIAAAKTARAARRRKERLAKSRERLIKARMIIPRLTGIRSNNAGVVRVPVPSGTVMVGGGILNHYRAWNRLSGFEESFPEGNRWRCDMGFGAGRLTCYSLAYALPTGTKCINRRVHSNNAGVVHASLPKGYTMVSGGVQNLYRRFNRLSAFEDSMPSGNRWRCDTGFGSGKLNCFVRGCKFPHGGKCITRRGFSNHAGWVWASCPRGYRVFGCGMLNHYRHFGPRSGFEDLRPIGNKCMGDMGFGAGRISVYARCCKITGPPATIKASKKKPRGKVKAGRKVCIGGAKWEMRSGFYCPSGNIASMNVVPWGRRGAAAKRNMCAFSCARRGNCKAFGYPTRGRRCMMKNMAGAQSGVLRKRCRGGKSNAGYIYYTKIGASCRTTYRRRRGLVLNRRRRFLVHRRRRRRRYNYRRRRHNYRRRRRRWHRRRRRRRRHNYRRRRRRRRRRWSRRRHNYRRRRRSRRRRWRL